MKNDALGTPGLIPNGNRLRQEMIKAISYLEVQRDLTNTPPTQGLTLKAFLDESLDYMGDKLLFVGAVPD